MQQFNYEGKFQNMPVLNVRVESTAAYYLSFAYKYGIRNINIPSYLF